MNNSELMQYLLPGGPKSVTLLLLIVPLHAAELCHREACIKSHATCVYFDWSVLAVAFLRNYDSSGVHVLVSFL